MFNKILVALDFSDNSVYVTEQSAMLAAALGASIRLIHVQVLQAGDLQYDAGTSEQRDRLSREPGGELFNLETYSSQVRRHGVQVDYLSTSGNPSDQIPEAAAAFGADLIVLGSHGHGKLYHMLAGGTRENILTQRVLPCASCASLCASSILVVSETVLPHELELLLSEPIKNTATPKNFLFASIDGLCSDLAWSVKKEGHQVKLSIQDSSAADIADGFVEKVPQWEAEVDWADVIVFDDVLGQGTIASELRARGKAVLGGTAYTDMLEDDRSFGQRELKRFGIPIIPFEEFHDFATAIAYVQANPAKYVVKPSGEAQNVKRSLFVGQEEDGKDVLQVLEAYQRLMSERIKVFQLQRRVDGVEVAVGAFFNGTKFLSPVNINFEHKKLFPGNIGPSTGEMGTTMYWSKPNRLFNQTLKRLEAKLAEVGYRGYIDLNCIVNHRGVYPLEFTSRFGYPTICIQQEGLLTPIGDLLFGVATGTLQEFKTRSGFQVGVRILVPPYPFDDAETFNTYSKNATILFKKPHLEGIHIEDVKQVDGQWLVAGHAGVALVVAGTGPTMRQAQTQAYARVKNVMIPNMYYRLDIGERWVEDSDRLHSWGYLREQ